MDDEVWIERDDQQFPEDREDQEGGEEREDRENREEREYQRQELAPEPTEKMGFEGKAVQQQATLGDDLWELHAATGKVVEFTAGRHLEDFRESEVLRAVVGSMLSVMDAALRRVAQQSAEQAGRLLGPEETLLLERVVAAAGEPEAEVWDFVRSIVPELLVRSQTELEAWHGA